MTIRFLSTTYDTNAPEIASHLNSLVGWIDSFHEEHIRLANHYRIEHKGIPVGSAAVHGQNLITSFILSPEHRHLSQPAYAALKRMESVTSAFVSTVDGFFLANALDEFREIKRQAYAFALAPERIRPATTGFRLRPADVKDIPHIKADSGDFFGPYLAYVGKPDGYTNLFVVEREGATVAYGISEKSRLYPATASIGMFVRESERLGGVGTVTIGLLIEEMLKRGLNPTAGCWYYNHASKRTLERAGLHAAARLLRIEY
jgi:hypothetical protein